MLSVSPLVLGYADMPVLRFEGMAVARGAHCLLAGDSGCGKTTLLYALAGLNPVISGSISVDGYVITQMGQAERDRFRGAHIGIVYQGLHLVKSLNVVQNVLLAAYAAGVKVEKMRAVAVLSRLGLAHKLDAMPDSLSQGQAQRVAIARAVLLKPALLLADEPTASLDDGACDKVVALLKDAANEVGATLVIATHDARVRAHFSEVVALS